MERQALDGFWLPRTVREEVLSSATEYDMLSFAAGRPAAPGDVGAVTVRWPRLRREQWQQLLTTLQVSRKRSPRGQEFWNRLLAALQALAARFADPLDSLRVQAQAALAAYTGYSEAMIGLALGGLDLMTPEIFPAAFGVSAAPPTPRPALSARIADALRLPDRRLETGWEPMMGLPGRVRFYRDGWQRPMLRWLSSQSTSPLFSSLPFPELVVGYGAGNVPGTALLITLLAQATTLAGEAPPAAVIRNSRREPIFSALVLDGIEAADPDLLASVAVLIWDYADDEVQDLLLSHASLVVAAASDETIAQIREAVGRASRASHRHPVRLHAHGHKVSFSAIGREALNHSLMAEGSEEPWIDVVATLAALDSVFWDQYGCLSSRIHFVETGGDDLASSNGGSYSPLQYAERLTAQMRLLASALPRGAWPRQQLHDRFDRYKLLEVTGKVQVLSRYDDEFVVVLDERTLDAAALRSTVNDCQGRIVMVRPVVDLMDVPERYLRLLPAASLQSLSVAIGQPGEGLTGRFLRFAEACGARGVTAIRTVGRGAFPQLAYSWDGFMPLDLIRHRPPGRFATIEFDAPYEQVLDTYRLLLRRGAAWGIHDASTSNRG